MNNTNTKKPIAEVLIQKSGSPNYTYSSISGSFQMDNLKVKDTLFFTKIGWQPLQRIIAKTDFQREIKVTMQAAEAVQLA